MQMGLASSSYILNNQYTVSTTYPYQPVNQSSTNGTNSANSSNAKNETISAA